MDLKQLFESQTGESTFNKIFRITGFVSLGIVDMLTMINFFTSIGESWILPFMGGVLVFMKIWNWIASLKAKNIRKKLHLIAWGSISLISIIAVISFGLAITTVSNADVTQAIGLQSLKDAAVATQLKTLTDERSKIQLQIDDIVSKKATLGIYDKGPADRLETQLTAARKRSDELDIKINAFSDGTAVKVAKSSARLNAQLIFGQIFSDAFARPAIWGFFFILGVAVELTLTLSSSASKEDEETKKKKKKLPRVKRVIDDEDDEEDSDEGVADQAGISTETLHVIDHSVENLKKGIVSEPIILEEEKIEEEKIIEVPKVEAIKDTPLVEVPKELADDEKKKKIELFENVINKMFKMIEEDGELFLLSEDQLSKETGMRLDKVQKVYKYLMYLDMIYFDKSHNIWKPKKTKPIMMNIIRGRINQNN